MVDSSPKNEHNERIKNYIHVICLTTIQKTLHYNEPNNSKYANDKNPMNRKKKRCFRGPKECKEQIPISKAILQEYKSKRRIEIMAWMDYEEAFYVVPHSWIITLL